jgi:DNA repair photolyase
MIEISRKSLLYKTGVEYGDYTINHIEGCAHGCKYPCYALQMSKRFGRIRTYREWLKPKLVGNAIELLNIEIPRLKDKIKSVHLCFMSDPFMVGFPEITQASLEIIRILNENGIRVTTLTKGIYPKHLANFATNADNEYGITLVSLKSSFREQFEPHAATFRTRINALSRLKKLGLRTWVSMEPYPTPNIVKQNISEILNKISFVDKIIFGRLNYNVDSTRFKNHKDFYDDLCHEVIEFCEIHGIEYYIKNGTMTCTGSSSNSQLDLVVPMAASGA